MNNNKITKREYEILNAILDNEYHEEDYFYSKEELDNLKNKLFLKEQNLK